MLSSANSSGKIPFIITMATLGLALGGINWTHGGLWGAYLFWVSAISFILFSLIWMQQAIVSMQTNAKLKRHGIWLGVLAIFMFLFSGILERGYDHATKKYGVNGKIDHQVGVANTEQIVTQITTPIDMLIHPGKTGLKLVKQSKLMNVHPGQDFDTMFVVANYQNKPIKFRVLLSVLPSTSAPLIQARQERYPVIEVKAKSKAKVVLQLHLSKNLPKHQHALTVGVSLFELGT